MALETPNALHASLTAFYALEDSVTPDLDNDPTFVVTAATGIAGIAFPPLPMFSGTFVDGLMISLQEPVAPAEGIWFLNGWITEEEIVGLTPTLDEFVSGDATVDDFALSVGNFFVWQPNVPIDWPFGFMSVAVFELPQVDSAEVPELPIAS